MKSRSLFWSLNGVGGASFVHFVGKPLTDMGVYHLLAQNIMEVRGTDLFNAGYCTGLIEALIEDRNVFAQ
jgi:hypothetical protein